MDVTPDGRTLYVAGDLGVTPITVATGTPRPFIETGQVPFSMVITPDSRKVVPGDVRPGFRPGVAPVSTARGAAGPLSPRPGRDVVAMALTPGARTLWAAAQLERHGDTDPHGDGQGWRPGPGGRPTGRDHRGASPCVMLRPRYAVLTDSQAQSSYKPFVVSLWF